MPYATPDATKAYAERFPEFLKAGHYRDFVGLTLSSLGLGTYLGRETEEDDRLYQESVREALLSGVNLVDSAINYRCMRSERSIGRALKAAVGEGRVKRGEVVVATKGGFIPFDGDVPPDPRRYFEEQYLAPGLCRPRDIAAGCHCMAPAYLRDQVGRSLKNLGLDAVDLYYVHNPETQLEDVDRPEFLRRLEAAFGEMERLAGEGKVRHYGTATWNGYRVAPAEEGYLSLDEVLKAAERAGGSRHRFAAVQLPYNLAMTEAAGSKNQELEGRKVPLLEAAQARGIAVFTSASILQSRLAQGLPAEVAQRFPGLSTDAQRALQFTRSTPGVTAALVGMKRVGHLRENLGVASVPPAGEAAVAGFIRGT